MESLKANLLPNGTHSSDRTMREFDIADLPKRAINEDAVRRRPLLDRFAERREDNDEGFLPDHWERWPTPPQARSRQSREQLELPRFDGHSEKRNSKRGRSEWW